MKKIMFFPFISLCVSVYCYLAVRFYYISSFYWEGVMFTLGYDLLTPEEEFISAVKTLGPIILLLILLIGICFYGKHHFEKWGWKERCGVFLFAVLGIALDIAFFVIWKKLN